jgi:hypothetical protein
MGSAGFCVEPVDRCQNSDRSFINGNDGNFRVDPLSTVRRSRFGIRRAESLLLEPSLSNGAHCRESVLAQAIGFLRRTPNPTTLTDQRDSALVGLLVSVFCLDIHPSDRQARNARRLAPQGVPVVLEAEIVTRPTSNFATTLQTHSAISSWESYSRLNCLRAQREKFIAFP